MAALATDAQGRVWVATAAASDQGNDAISVVTEAGATPQEVVTDVHTPLGLVRVDDTLYVSQADGVLALSGFDGTAFASRTTIVSFPDGTGEVNGIAMGSDGRLFVGISAACDACTPTDPCSPQHRAVRGRQVADVAEVGASLELDRTCTRTFGALRQHDHPSTVRNPPFGRVSRG